MNRHKRKKFRFWSCIVKFFISTVQEASPSLKAKEHEKWGAGSSFGLYLIKYTLFHFFLFQYPTPSLFGRLDKNGKRKMLWGFYVQEQTQSLWSIEKFQLTFHFFSFISHSMWIKCKSFLCYLCLFEGMKPFKRLVTFNITRISTKLWYTDVMFEPEA
jgi:hypothetical protein